MPLGYFQWNNLIRGRIRFFLISFGPTFEGWYTGMEKTHLQQVMQQLDPKASLDENVRLIEAQKLGFEVPLILVDENGEYAKALAEKLEALGYLNAFYILGGAADLSIEHSQKA